MIVKFLKRLHLWVCVAEPWGIIVVVIAIVPQFVTFVIDLEDRDFEKLSRAWELIIEDDRIARTYEAGDSKTTPIQSISENKEDKEEQSNLGGAIFQALEFLNRDVEGRVCFEWLKPIFKWLTGTIHRDCVIPSRPRESLANRYLPNKHLNGIDLANANLKRTNFEAANLSGANLSGANLRKAILRDTNLADARLIDAQLHDSILRNADLRGAKLMNAILYESNLTNAYFSGADLTKAKLKGANLTKSDLSEAMGVTLKQLKEACITKDGQEPELPAGIRIEWKEQTC